MAEECTHNCSTCSSNCSSREKNSLLEQPHALSSVKHIIGVVSGKGGVGKSIVTSMLAVTMQRLGYKTAILDADITGPSIPKAFGLRKPVEVGIFLCCDCSALSSIRARTSRSSSSALMRSNRIRFSIARSLKLPIDGIISCPVL